MRRFATVAFWWCGPVLAAIAGFFAGFLPVVLVFLSLGGLDPAHNLGMSDELVTYLVFLGGLFVAGVAAGIAAARGPRLFALTVAVPVLGGSAAYLAVILAFDITAGSGAAMTWLAAAAALVAAGLTPRLLARNAQAFLARAS